MWNSISYLTGRLTGMYFTTNNPQTQCKGLCEPIPNMHYGLGSVVVQVSLQSQWTLFPGLSVCIQRTTKALII